MNNYVTFDDALEEIKAQGEQERRTIEIAEEMANIIESLSDARIRIGLTQRDLADKCGIKQSAIARMESLQVIPRLDTLLKVSYSLNVKFEITEGVRASVHLIKGGNKYSSKYTDSTYAWSNGCVAACIPPVAAAG